MTRISLTNIPSGILAGIPALTLVAILALVPVAPALAGDEWTPDDVMTAESAGGWTLSRDGSLAAWTRSRVATIDGNERRVSTLWLTRLGGERPESIQLTRGNDGASSPRFSPDGSLIAFLTGRKPPGGGDEKGETSGSQIWIIPVNGGEAYPITRSDRGVRSFAWIDDETFVYLAQESKTLWEQDRGKSKDTAVVVEDAPHQPPVRVFRVSAEGGPAKRITDNTDWISSMSVSPDGRRAVITAAQSLSYQFDQKTPPHTLLLDLESGKSTRMFADTGLLPGSIRWRNDSNGFYFTNQRTNHPIYRMATITELHLHDLDTGVTEAVEIDWPRGLSFGYAPIKSGVIALLADGAHLRPARIDRTIAGWRRTDLTGDRVSGIGGMSVSRDGKTILFQHSTATTPTQTFAARLDGARVVDQAQVTELNKSFAKKDTGRVEVITWIGAEGDEIEGILHYPLGYEAGKRYPLILNPHGGPAGTSRDAWRLSYGSPLLLWRQLGAFILQPNYHGSAGYGLEFVESIGGGRYYDLEIPDCDAGVDYLIQLGLVDPDRLAVAGWSNGGILAAELITRSTRWKAASVGAADVEWISDWANVDFGAAFDNYYFGASPLEDPMLYIEKSPFFRLGNVTTPTIIYTGTEDRNVPPHQSWSLFRALQQLGRAPVRLVLFPGEPHGLRKFAHQRRKMAEDLAWLRRYLFLDEMPASEAMKEGSRLARLIARNEAATAGVHYGESVNGALVPEFVNDGELQVTRFEITCAQFAAFDDAAGFSNAFGNHPASEVTFEQAQAYARRLADHLDRPVRLPTRAEAEALANKAGTGGNTLDHWAGYAPNPDDLRGLRAVMAGMLDASTLLAIVGSFGPASEGKLFDLDGNVAEWAVDENGEGVLIGPSADQPAKAHNRTAVGEAYRGFRVVIGQVMDD